MLEIIYLIITNNGETKRCERAFTNKSIARRFCLAMKKRNMFLLGWRCDNPSDNEYMCKHIRIFEINRSKL